MNKFDSPANLINFASIATATSFLVVILLAVLVLWPKFQELEIVRGNIEEKKAELQAKEEYVLRLDELKVKLKEHQEEISKINTALPVNPSLPSLFNFLQKASSESGLILTEISPFTISSSEDFANLKEAIFSIKVSGSYSSLKNFISILEKSARLIEVENLSLSLGGEGESPAFNLRLKTFSY